MEYVMPRSGATVSHMGHDEHVWRQATGAAIRAEYGARRWSQAEARRRSGMARSTFLRIANGERMADLEQLDVIAELFGMTLGQLVARIEAMASDVERGEL